jgi:hypothetical protein
MRWIGLWGRGGWVVELGVVVVCHREAGRDLMVVGCTSCGGMGGLDGDDDTQGGGLSLKRTGGILEYLWFRSMA